MSVLRNPPSNYIAGRFIPIPGDTIASRDPADPSRIIWSGAPDSAHVDQAVAAAREAFPEWAATSLDERIAFLKLWAEMTSKRANDIAGLITDEMGKTLADSQAEAKLLSDKVNITLDRISLGRVTGYELPLAASRQAVCRFKPHGVMAVIGPFNFPAHLANGHFVPALLMGNTIVLKPSEKTPGVGQLLAEMLHEIGAPPGVFNVIQGAGDIASRLVSHADIDGILFTGSWPVGRRILEANLDRPGRIIALEMGGNNPSVVMDDAHLKQAVIENVRSAFATTGQRCTCTRRIIVQRTIAERFIPAFCKAASTLTIGPGRSETPVFMGPLINRTSVEAVLNFQRDLVARGGRILVQTSELSQAAGGNPRTRTMSAKASVQETCFITPGVIEVERFTLEHDREVFGPLAQIAIVDVLEQAIEQANATQYGLAASIFTASRDTFEAFFRNCRSGCINWNTGTAGASGKLPFGGVGHSGNHRPAGAFSADYCGYPVANMVESSSDVALPPGMLWEDRWL
jgi:succinylglutamic semialdehyde dehydrogenase